MFLFFNLIKPNKFSDKTSRKMMQNRICLNLNHRPTLTNTIGL